MDKPTTPTGNPSAEQQDPESFVPDTQKIVHRHLQDPNHVITEEEMQSVKISTEHFDKTHKELLDNAVAPESDEQKPDAEAKIITPWDVTT